MTTPRTAARRPSASSAASVPAVVEGDPLRWVWLALVSGLFFIRWWQPTEGTALGDTLPIALGWFLALALTGWLGLRCTGWRIRWDGLHWAVWLLAGGHIVSGLIIAGTSGDRRAAVNLIWEWTSLAVAFPLLRSALPTIEARREWTVVALAAVVTLSAYGLTQRFVFYPQMVKQYERVRQELDQLEQTAASGGVADVQRMQKLRSEMLGNGLSPHMLSGSGRALLEGRLMHSSEPLGRFALANTFAGLLLVWWAVLVFQTVQFWLSGREKHSQLAAAGNLLAVDQNTGRASGTSTPDIGKPLLPLMGMVLSLTVIGYCLLLTKSRTAYVGCMVSLFVWTLASRWKWSLQSRRVVLWGVGCAAALGGITLIASLTGGLDRLVLAEAPKSLQYRLDYWRSSLQVIRESPLFGVGPGQFRQSYLAHKLPRSSEEIADPHNLVLDVWANGGLLALAGLSWLVVCLTRSLWSGAAQSTLPTAGDAENSAQVPTPAAIPLPPSVSESGVPPRPARKIPQPRVLPRKAPLEADITSVRMNGWSSPIRWGALVSLLSLWLVEGALETPLLAFAVAWSVAILVLDVILPVEAIRPLSWMAASLGLLTHLCGAGGIGMPAITQLLVLVAIFAVSETPVGTEVNLPKWGSWGVLAGGLALLGGGFWTAAQPVGQVQSLLTRADFAKLPSQREQLYQQATVADSLAPEPWERLAEVLFAKWRSNPEPDDADFQRAVVAQWAAIERNPLSFHTHRALGMFYNAVAEKSGRKEDYEAAVREMQVALLRYPHNAELQADAADVFQAAGDTKLAATTARRALEQDDVNHAAGHRDKWLVERVRKRMEQLAVSKVD
ncbi:MAG: hypothetical protein JWN70_3404 [Planctomycetaceae bacterium]|nr:hypothetical protein [Planctomycetaceae bacterium]